MPAVRARPKAGLQRRGFQESGEVIRKIKLNFVFSSWRPYALTNAGPMSETNDMASSLSGGAMKAGQLNADRER